MPRRRLPPPTLPGQAPTLEEAAAEVIGQLGAVELDPELVPEGWVPPPDGEYRAWVSGTGGKAPVWSRREAGVLARYVVEHRELRRKMVEAAKAAGRPPISMPLRQTVVVCPECNGLQIASSRANRRNDECGVCPLDCPRRDRHASNQINCDQCRRHMQVLWSSDDPIPEDWR